MLIDVWKEPCELAEDWKNLNTEELTKIAKEIKDMRNELCFFCGKYKDAHLGVCDGCRWNGVEE